MTELTHEAVRDAMAIADEVSPTPQRALAALKILRSEVLHRWEQRTALSFRLQDLRNQVKAAGLPDDAPLYLALHAATATAEAWMHPDTLSEAARDHLAWIKLELRAFQEGALGLIEAERRRQVQQLDYSHARDDTYLDGQLAYAAGTYALIGGGVAPELAGTWWPWHEATFKPGTDRMRALVKSAALIVAELKRMQRAEQAGG